MCASELLAQRGIERERKRERERERGRERKRGCSDAASPLSRRQVVQELRGLYKAVMEGVLNLVDKFFEMVGSGGVVVMQWCGGDAVVWW